MLKKIILFFSLFIPTLSLGESSLSNNAYYRQFQSIFERIDKEYVEEPDKQKMTDSAINSMLNALDPHSSYFTDEDLEDFMQQTKGEFGGVGVEVMYDKGAIKVIAPIDDLPADKAGIKAGDYIVGVNEEIVSDLGFYKSIKEMRGEPGSKVKLTVVREEEQKPLEFELSREIVKIKPVKSRMEGEDIAYVRISTFNENTFPELKKAVNDLKKKTKGIILDLRNNPGGLLDQAYLTADYFIDSGVIVSTKGRTQNSNSVLSANQFGEKAPKVPMVVMINSGSASASEIVAGALGDHKRAILLGTKSFGKGSVQTFVQVNDRAAVKFTTAKYYTPSGRSIQAEGIEPDIYVEQAKLEYPDKKDDKRFSEASLKNHIKGEKEQKKKIPENKEENKTENKKEKDETKKDKENKEKEFAKNSESYKKDHQFAVAYDVLRGLIINGEKK